MIDQLSELLGVDYFGWVGCIRTVVVGVCRIEGEANGKVEMQDF